MLLLISFLALISISLLLSSIIRRDKIGGYVFKPLSTAIIVVLALFALAQPEANLAYGLIITSGLFLSLAGDIALILPVKKALPIGMSFFFLTNILYGLAFLWRGAFLPQDILPGLAILLFGLIIYTLLYSSLGKMRLPVFIYLLALSFMLWRAVLTPSALVVFGGSLFYLADSLEAFYRFRDQSTWIRLVYLSLYYAAQLLIALSTSF